MKKNDLLRVVSLATFLALTACTTTVIPENITEPETPTPHAQLINNEETDEPDVVSENPTEEPEATDEPEIIPEPEVENQTTESADPQTVPIPYEYGSLLDNVLFSNYDKENEEVTKYQFFYVDENLYFEETWGGYGEEPGDDYVMSYFAGEVFVSDENDITYEGGKLTIPCTVKRFSSFSLAGEYWDEGKDAVITLENDEINIEYHGDDESGYTGTKDDETTLYDDWYTFDTFQEMNPDYGYNTNMEFMDDWWCDEGDTHYYIRMYPNGTIAFIEKTPGEPVILELGYWGWKDYYESGDDYLMNIAWLVSPIGNANMPEEGMAFIKIDGSDLYFMDNIGGVPDEENPRIYQSKWYLSGRQCPIDYFAIW